MGRIAGFLAALLFLAPVCSAQTVTITEEAYGTVKKIICAWTSDGSGDASDTTSLSYTGEVVLLVTDPGATAPTDNWDLTVTDEDSVDVLIGAGADRDTANTEQVQGTSLGVVANDTLTFTISNAGASKTGTIYVYIR